MILLSKEEVKQFSRSAITSTIVGKLREYYFVALPFVGAVEEQARGYINVLSQTQKYLALGGSAYLLGIAIGYRFKSRKENKKLDAIILKMDRLNSKLSPIVQEIYTKPPVDE